MARLNPRIFAIALVVLSTGQQSSARELTDAQSVREECSAYSEGDMRDCLAKKASSAFHYKDYKSCESEIELVPAERDWGFVELGNALEDALFEFRL